MSDDLRQAVEYAAWWTRMAIDVARTEGAHPGLISHLTAADVQHRATEQLITHSPLDGAHVRSAGLKPRASEAQPPSKAAA